MTVSAAARSKKMLEAKGYLVGITERWNPHAMIRQDLFGFVDLIALRKDETLAVQATVGKGQAAKHITKIADSPLVAQVREAGWRIVVHSWRKVQPSGKWECREVDVS